MQMKQDQRQISTRKKIASQKLHSADEVEPEAEEKKKPVMSLQESKTQKNKEEVLINRLETGEPCSEACTY